MAQLNVTVGDMEGNTEKIIQACQQARDELHGDVVVFPELALTGYPPEDLLLRPGLYSRVLHGIEMIRQQVQGIMVVVGYPHQSTGGTYNAAAVIHNGAMLGYYHKQHLPNYSVFDEKRYFVPGGEPCVIEFKGQRLGITICEDIWNPGPMHQAYEAGAELMLNLNASPFHANKGREREAVLTQRIVESPIPVVYVNLVGGQDELVFDGASFVMDGQGYVTQRAPAFVEGLYPVTLRREGKKLFPASQAPVLPLETVFSPPCGG